MLLEVNLRHLHRVSLSVHLAQWSLKRRLLLSHSGQRHLLSVSVTLRQVPSRLVQVSLQLHLLLRFPLDNLQLYLQGSVGSFIISCCAIRTNSTCTASGTPSAAPSTGFGQTNGFSSAPMSITTSAPGSTSFSFGANPSPAPTPGFGQPQAGAFQFAPASSVAAQGAFAFGGPASQPSSAPGKLP